MNSSVKSTSTSMVDCISQNPGISAKTCTCGGAGCANCGGQGYVRPRFFAGQLLTEEDLQSLSDYVVAKNRLHNRHFFGEGVVCGLEVTCHPCGGGTVVVAPGHALDCCGNDIVLNCPTELDINAMVRELRLNTLGGYDCGDPCAPPKKTDCNDNSKKDSGEKDRPPARRYCLYIRYCEEQTDPVIPYGTDEPCVSPGCEPTRIREGVRFELRCDEGDANPDNLFTRIGYCLGDLIALERVAREGAWQRTVIASQVRADQAISESSPTGFNFNKLNDARDKLNASSNSFAASEEKKLAGTASNRQKELQTLLDATLHVVSLVAGYLTDNEGRSQTIPATNLAQGESPSGGFENAQKAVEAAYQAVGDKIDKILETTVEQAYAHALFEIGRAVVNEAASSDTESSDTPPQADRTARLFLTYGSVATPTLLRVQFLSSEALREWLLERIDKAPWLTDGSLRQDVIAIRLQTPKQLQSLQRSDVSSCDTAGEKLLEALLRYLRQCVCRAFLPPCPPCDDTAVLLACLKVRDCEVIEICNLERTFVLSPVAFRYWVPPLHWLGEFIEKLCCRPIRLYGEPQRYIKDFRQLLETRLTETDILELAESAGLVRNGDKQRLLNTISALGDLLLRERAEKTVQLDSAEGTSP